MLVPPQMHPGLPHDSVPHTLHFVSSVDEARNLAAARRALSFVAADPLSRLDAWLSGQVHNLYVCGRLGEGYDVPACARVVVHRQTDSPIWIYQAIGRALRRHGSKAHGEAFGITGRTAEALWCALLMAESGKPALLAMNAQRAGEGIMKSEHQGI